MKLYGRKDIEIFLQREKLGAQKIDLPFGLSTPGHPRNQLKRILLSESIQDRSILDVGSSIGQMCVTAIQNGANRAVGFELNRDRIRQAQEISNILQLSPPPEYHRTDIEHSILTENFDIVLLLNVLHQFQDPISVLKNLTKLVNHRLIIECASLNRYDAQITKTGPLSRMLFSNSSTAYVGQGHPRDHSERFFFSRKALSTILSQHSMNFWRVDHYTSESKGRFILDCKKLSIDRMILVAGCNSSGKSTFCEKVKQNRFTEELKYEDYSKEVFISPAKLWGRHLDSFFPKQNAAECLVHYDISLIDKFKLHSFTKDPATSVIECSKKIDAVLIAPSIETLKQQMFVSEIEGRPAKKSDFHRRHLERYSEPDYVLNLYTDWLDFLEGLSASIRLFVYVEVSEGRKLIRCQSFAEARQAIQEIYGTVSRHVTSVP